MRRVILFKVTIIILAVLASATYLIQRERPIIPTRPDDSHEVYSLVTGLDITYPTSLRRVDDIGSLSEEGFRAVGFTNFLSPSSRFPYISYPEDGQIYTQVGEFRDFPGSLDKWLAESAGKMPDIERLFFIEDGSYATRALISEEITELDSQKAICHTVKYRRSKDLVVIFTYFEYANHIFQVVNLTGSSPGAVCGSNIIQIKIGA
jgi:hypothetical protein